MTGVQTCALPIFGPNHKGHVNSPILPGENHAYPEADWPTREKITKRHLDGDRHIFDCFERIRDTAVAMREALCRADWDAVGRHIAEEWANRKRLAPGVTTPAIEALISKATAAGATAAKVCGAGGGGCLFCYGPPSARDAVGRALAAGGARVLSFTIEREGLRLA